MKWKGLGRAAHRCSSIIAPLLWPHCLAGAILIFSISFRELVGSVLLRPINSRRVSQHLWFCSRFKVAMRKVMKKVLVEKSARMALKHCGF
jgi:ABC-type spermidine/putrescine transport system permease subunit II